MALTTIPPPNSSAAARLLVSGFRYLRFPETLESDFRAEYRARLRAWNRDLRGTRLAAGDTLTVYARRAD